MKSRFEHDEGGLNALKISRQVEAGGRIDETVSVFVSQTKGCGFKTPASAANLPVAKPQKKITPWVWIEASAKGVNTTSIRPPAQCCPPFQFRGDEQQSVPGKELKRNMYSMNISGTFGRKRFPVTGFCVRAHHRAQDNGPEDGHHCSVSFTRSESKEN